MIVPTVLAIAVTAIGIVFEWCIPQLKTTALQMLVWGFCLSTVVLYHTTFTINSLAHIFGDRRFNTTDTSRNNLFLALITLGE
jgi:stearoyl-CoA desaturase (delta-9 desaturase)